MFGEVMEIVAGRRCASQPARLAGFRRRRVRGAVYPALVPDAGETLEGVLWQGLDGPALARIDRFEGAIYERPALDVTLGSGERRGAFVYLLRPEHRSLAGDAPWDEVDFRQRHLRDYLVACRAFVREAEDAGSAARRRPV
jgi:gamma-glutamylcyclotransferase (GGCT)/AIG2-like uncharacterized protein YtfP